MIVYNLATNSQPYYSVRFILKVKIRSVNWKKNQNKWNEYISVWCCSILLWDRWCAVCVSIQNLIGCSFVADLIEKSVGKNHKTLYYITYLYTLQKSNTHHTLNIYTTTSDVRNVPARHLLRQWQYFVEMEDIWAIK